MKTVWVVAANGSRARIFAAGGATGPLSELEDFVHPASRAKDQALNSDRPGRAFDSAGAGRHAMEPGADPKRHEAENFAKDIAAHLQDARNKRRFDALVLTAAPAFLGLLRDALDAQTLRLVSGQIAKDLTSLEAAALRGRLPERL